MRTIKMCRGGSRSGRWGWGGGVTVKYAWSGVVGVRVVIKDSQLKLL